jgi:hypothetical protein
LVHVSGSHPLAHGWPWYSSVRKTDFSQAWNCLTSVVLSALFIVVLLYSWFIPVKIAA